MFNIQDTTKKVVKVLRRKQIRVIIAYFNTIRKLLGSHKLFEFDIRKQSTLSLAHVEKHILLYLSSSCGKTYIREIG